VAGTQAAAIERAGATYTGPAVTMDGNIVTANGPKSSRLFARTIAKTLAATSMGSAAGDSPL
jgi:putative intracellular protease/amidase